jgi:protein TonB
MIWALAIAVILHLVIWLNFTLKEKPPENMPTKVIEVSFITKSAPIKAKQNDEVVAEPQPASLPELPKPTPIKPVNKPVEKLIPKPIVKPIEPKKESPKPKVVVVQKSEITVKKVEKVEKAVKTAKVEPPKKIEEPPKEKPRLSLESLQQQISQVGTEVRQQQVSERDKYISAFSSKVKRIGQEIYESGTLPAGILETHIEINPDGTLNNFKITRSSGNKKLDEAVENMIRSSAPYSALSLQLQSESNTLSFNRVWEFYGD